LPHFVAGPENYLAAVAVRALLGRTVGPYNLILFYGPPSAGKSHLAVGLAAAWKARFRGQPLISATGLQFARQLSDAIDTKTTDDFATRYRQASLLVLEDLQYLQARQAAQRELIGILDALRDTESRIVLTAGRPPAQLAGIAPSLRSRLMAGLTVPLALPGRSARLVILNRLADVGHVQIQEITLEILANALNVTVPKLFAALVELQLFAKDNNETIDAEIARRYVAKRTPPRQPSLRSIASTTAREFSLTTAELRSASRRRLVVLARGVAMYLARNLTDKSLNLIGRYFGSRDHTTVAYACRKTEERLEVQPEIRHAVLELQEKLTTA
jgi:chromosomal replication initiator protein